MIMMKPKDACLFWTLIFFVLGPFLYASIDERLPVFFTYFNYTERELIPLRQLQSSDQMSRKQLMHWDEEVSDLIKKNKQQENASRIYAYLYVAQRDAGYLSYQLKGR